MAKVRIRSVWVLVGLAVTVGCRGGYPPGAGELLPYPETATVDVVDVYHGEEVADPYRWLEDADAPEVQEWIEAQNRVTFTYLEGIPGREALTRRLEALWDYERISTPAREGEEFFFTRNDGLQPQSVLVAADEPAGRGRVLLNPNELSEDGTVSLARYSVSPDGRLLAYALSSGGSDWLEWRVREVGTGEDLADVVRWSKFSTAEWAPDGSGFFYLRYDEPAPGEELRGVNLEQKLYFHRLGTPQDEDRLVLHRPDQPRWRYAMTASEDGAYLVVTAAVGTERTRVVMYKQLGSEAGKFVTLVGAPDADYRFLGNDGPVFYLFTNLDAPRGRVVAVDTRFPDRQHWREVVPEQPETLQSANLFGDEVVCLYLMDARSQVRRFGLDGSDRGEVEIPGLGSVSGFTGRRDHNETYFTYTSFNTPGEVHRLDLTTGGTTMVFRPSVDFEPDEYETRQVFFSSKDGTRVPMFLSHRRNLRITGDTPVLLYGYGGFNSPQRPRFSVPNLTWMEMGGIYAVANIRGGGEYGREWHQAGSREHKQNTFDDFIAAAEWLIANGHTSPNKLAIAGGSNGGLLVGAVLNQRPDLFGAALPAVGVMDMLRFHRFTIGWAWVSDYGSAEDPDMFPILRGYSPLHNIRPGTAYPATLVTTADHDDRVVPAHSFKYAAALQAAQGGEAPVLLRVTTRAGHGAGKPVTMQVEEAADRLAFLSANLGVRVPAW